MFQLIKFFKFNTLSILILSLSGCLKFQKPAIIILKDSSAKNTQEKYFSPATDTEIISHDIELPKKSSDNLNISNLQDFQVSEEQIHHNQKEKNNINESSISENHSNDTINAGSEKLSEVNQNNNINVNNAEDRPDTLDLNTELTNILSEEKSNKNEPIQNQSEKKIPEGLTTTLLKPLEGKLIQSFTNTHSGINIEAKLGAEIKNPYDGQVVFSAFDKKFGNLVIIKLKDSNFFIAFAHLDDLILTKSQQVTRGQVIGYVGQTGNVDNPQLHIAIKHDKSSIDPTLYLNY